MKKFFSIIKSYVSELKAYEIFYVSPTQISRNAIVRRKNHLFSQFLDSIGETLTDTEKSQPIKF